MNERWESVAARTIDALGVQPGELIQIRDYAHRYDVLQEMLLAVERRGATPLPQIFPTTYLQRLLSTTDPSYLAQWDVHRRGWAKTTDRVLILAGEDRDLSTAPEGARAAWLAAVMRLEEVETTRTIPTLLAAIPSEPMAARRGVALEALEDVLIQALGAEPIVLEREVDRAMSVLGTATTLTLRTGVSAELHLERGDRRWFREYGMLPNTSVLGGSIQAVLNMPSGSVYTTVVEQTPEGTIWLPQAAMAHDVTFTFEQGRITRLEAAQGANELSALLDSHTGESRRISHIGIGLNPFLDHMIDWVLVDEHCHGAIFIALGENRYLGGENASSLNIDFTVRHADLIAGETAVILKGRLIA